MGVSFFQHTIRFIFINYDETSWIFQLVISADVSYILDSVQCSGVSF